MAEKTQVRELLSRVKHPQLQGIVKALEVRYELDDIAYSEASNDLIAAVSKIPYYQLSQKHSGIQTSGGNSGSNSGFGVQRKGGRNSSSCCNSQGKVHTGYYQNWKGWSKEDRKIVIAIRKKKGSKSG